MKFKYFEILWKMVTKINNKKLIKALLKPFSLRLYSPQERYDIWQNLIKKVFEEEKNFIEQEMFLSMITTIIKVSEKYGNPGVISYSSKKISKIPLKVNVIMKEFRNYDFEINKEIYTTSTIYDLKK